MGRGGGRRSGEGTLRPEVEPERRFELLTCAVRGRSAGFRSVPGNALQSQAVHVIQRTHARPEILQDGVGRTEDPIVGTESGRIRSNGSSLARWSGNRGAAGSLFEPDVSPGWMKLRRRPPFHSRARRHRLARRARVLIQKDKTSNVLSFVWSMWREMPANTVITMLDVDGSRPSDLGAAHAIPVRTASRKEVPVHLTVMPWNPWRDRCLQHA